MVRSQQLGMFGHIRSGGESEEKRAAPAGGAFGPYPAPVRFRQLLDNRQPDAGPPYPFFLRRRAPVIAVEDTGQVFGGYALTGIGHGYEQVTVRPATGFVKAYTDRYRIAPGRIAQRIAQEVHHDLRYPVRVHQRRRESRLDVQFEGYALSFRLGPGS